MKIRGEIKLTMEQLQIKKLRPNQLKPINHVLDGKDTLLIAATSFGKWSPWSSYQRPVGYRSECHQGKAQEGCSLSGHRA